MTTIHPTAIVEPQVEIGKNVVIEPYAIVKGNVTLGDNVTIKSYVYVDGNTTIGEGTTIWPSVMIGNKCQDLKFKGEVTKVVIGRNCEIREFVTITSSTFEETKVSIGDNCLIMIGSHIAHNCSVGNNVVMSNNSLLAGHVQVEDFAVIGGMVGIHQYVRVGCHSMIGGLSRVTHDVPPYTIGLGSPYALGGVNKVGLQRRNFSFEVRKAIATAFKLLYRSNLPLVQALDKIEKEFSSFSEVLYFVKFCRESKRGVTSSFKGSSQQNWILNDKDCSSMTGKNDQDNCSNFSEEDLLVETRMKK